jgi:hypothetical protein
MDIFSQLSTVLGSSWASGINLYLTLAALGILQRMHLVQLPGDMAGISNIWVILAALMMYAIEFVADKVPFVDNVWDSVHTFIRPIAGGAMAFMATSQAGPLVQVPVALAGGAVALSSHLAKSATRVSINTTTPPGTNAVASLTEDGLVAVVIWLIVQHPIIATFVILGLIVACVVLIRLFARFIKRVFRFFFPAAKPA